MMTTTAKKYVLPEELCQSVLWVKLHFVIYQTRQELFRVMYSVTCLVRTLIRIFKKYDVGDIVGIRGVVFKTQTVRYP